MPEKDASKSSRSDSDTNEDESSEEENVSPNNVEIKKAKRKDLCICGRKEILEIDCFCCPEVRAISEGNFKENQCIKMSKQFQTLCLEKLVLKMFWLGYMKLKETRLKKKTKSKTDHYALLPTNNLYDGYIKGFGKEAGEFSHHVICGKLDNIT